MHAFINRYRKIQNRIEIGKVKIIPINGNLFSPYFSIIFHKGQINPEFEEDIKEANIGLIKLPEYSHWVNIGDINKRLEEYSIFKLINKDSNGNAILNYKTLYPYFPNSFKNNDIIKLSDKSHDRRIFKRFILRNYQISIIKLLN